MARTPTKIPAKAAAAWERGDELEAERLSSLRSRQLRNRLGPPGRPQVASTAAAPPARGPTAAPPVAAVAPAPPQAPAAEPTVDEIEALDTREEALAILRTIKIRMAGADEVRFGGLAEKALSAINRIEQIDRRRPAPPAPDAVHEAIRLARDDAAAHLLRYTAAAAQRWDRFLPRLRVALGIAAPELLVELDALMGTGKAAAG